MFHPGKEPLFTGLLPVWWTPLKLIFEGRQTVNLVRCGRPPEELACEFEPTAQSISTWVKQAEWDDGKRVTPQG
jgi:hypothetical protein